MKIHILTIKLMLLLLIFSSEAFSQGQNTTQGKDFWLSFGNNEVDNITPVLQVRIVATKATSVTFAYTEGSSVTYNIPAGDVFTHELSDTEKGHVYHYSTTTGVTNKSLRITSDENISVFAINLKFTISDATNVLPVTNYGTSYYHMSYYTIPGGMDGYTVIATEDNTNIYEEGALATTINRGQVYSRYNSTDFTGRNITSDKPIAYFTTNTCVNVPRGYAACDCLFQQLVPVHSWGNRFLVPVTKRGKERVRIVASQDGTTITQSGGIIQATPGTGSLLLNKGQFVELEATLNNNGCYINSDKPVAVASLLTGKNYTGLVYNEGDPALAWVPPIEQTVGNVAIAPFAASGSSVLKEHYALIVTPSATKNQTTMTIGSGVPQVLSGGTWTNNAISGHSFYSVKLLNETETYYFENPSGLSVMGYGLGSYESYYYLAASSARQLNPAFYVNDIHFQDADGQIYCNTPFRFKAIIQFPVNSSPGYLKWYIDGVEETTARDTREWTKPSLSLNTPHTIKMVVIDSQNNTYELVTTFTVVDPVPLTISPADSVGICPGVTSAVLTATSGPSRYQWYKDGNPILGATQGTYTATELGSYTVTGFYGTCSPDVSLPVVVKMAPSVVYWNKNAANSNWNDPANWTNVAGAPLNGVPSSCSDVHIPGNATNYPSLDVTNTPRATYGNPTCNNITYHFGAEVAQPHLLTYQKAFVDYNFGYLDTDNHYKSDGDPRSASPMKRGQWYALSAPLKKMVTGDFSVGGYPNMWQRELELTTTKLGDFAGQWKTPVGTNAIELGADRAYAISIWAGEYISGLPGEGETYHTNLNSLKGIMQMPYFENPAVSALHRLHNYDGSCSTFKYYNSSKPGCPVVPDTVPGLIVRGNEAYRFIFDNNLVGGNFKVSVPAGKEIMIGNPFISTLDFRKFYELNQTKIDAYYRLYVDNVWQSYSYAANVGASGGFIAPLQAFFISTKGSSGNVDLLFPPDMVSVTKPTNKLRASTETKNVIEVNARNSKGNSSVIISLNDTESKNVRQLFSASYPDVPQLYTLDASNTKNAILYKDSYNVDIPLGILCDKEENVTLDIRNIENLNASSLQLFDKVNNTYADLLKNPIYVFKNDPSATSDRFILMVGKNNTATGIDFAETTAASIFAVGKVLHVKSENLIEEVKISTVQGIIVQTDSQINTSEYSRKLQVETGVYIVTVKLENNTTITKKIVIN